MKVVEMIAFAGKPVRDPLLLHHNLLSDGADGAGGVSHGEAKVICPGRNRHQKIQAVRLAIGRPQEVSVAASELMIWPDDSKHAGDRAMRLARYLDDDANSHW
jgi:hypothetical protein